MSKKLSRKELLQLAEDEGLENFRNLNMVKICEMINKNRSDKNKIDCNLYVRSKNPVPKPDTRAGTPKITKSKSRKITKAKPSKVETIPPTKETQKFEYLLKHEGQFEKGDKKYGIVIVPLIITAFTEESSVVYSSNNLPYVKILDLDKEFNTPHKTNGSLRLFSEKMKHERNHPIHLRIEWNEDFHLSWTIATTISIKKLINIKKVQVVKYIDASGLVNGGKVIKYTKKEKGMEYIDYLCIQDDNDGYMKQLNDIIIL